MTFTAPKISCDLRTGDSAFAAYLIFFFSIILIFSEFAAEESGDAIELSSSSCYYFLVSGDVSSSITIVASLSAYLEVSTDLDSSFYV